MKKLLLPIILLTTISNAELFDFENSKAFSGKAETKLELGTKSFKELSVDHKISADIKLFDFANIYANVKYGKDYGQSVSLKTARDTNLGFGLDFKEFGKVSLQYDFDTTIEAIYKNSIPIKDWNNDFEVKYMYHNALNKKDNYEVKKDEHGVYLGVKSTNEFLDNLQGYIKPELTLSFEIAKASGTYNNKDLTNLKSVNVSIVPNLEAGIRYEDGFYGDLKLGVGGNGDFSIVSGEKEEEASRLTPEEKKAIELTKLNSSFLIYAQANVGVKLDENIHNVDGLILKPEIEAYMSSKKLNTHLKFKFDTEYEVLKGLSVEAGLADKVNFGKADDNKFKYLNNEVLLNLGLKYEW